MTGKRPRRSAWQASATTITGRKAREDGSVLSLTEVSNAAGLKTTTVMSYVNRTGVGKSTAPITHLARPDYKVGLTPYWSQAQLDRYMTAKAEQTERQSEKLAGLPMVTEEEAEERGWWGIRRLAAWSGFAVVTVHRMATQEGFPEPVGLGPSRGLHPYVLRDRAAVEEWLRSKRPDWTPVEEEKS